MKEKLHFDYRRFNKKKKIIGSTRYFVRRNNFRGVDVAAISKEIATGRDGNGRTRKEQ